MRKVYSDKDIRPLNLLELYLEIYSEDNGREGLDLVRDGASAYLREYGGSEFYRAICGWGAEGRLIWPEGFGPDDYA